MGAFGEWLHRKVRKGMTPEEVARDIRDLFRGMRRKDVVDTSQDEIIRMLEVENGELRLYLAALIWALLERDVLDQEEFTRLVDLVDRSDGKADGRYEGEIAAWGVGGQPAADV